MTDIPREYTNGEVTVIWKSSLCTHSGLCVRGLPRVFSLKQRPWVQPDKATTLQVIQQVQQCPSGALTYRMNEGFDDSSA